MEVDFFFFNAQANNHPVVKYQFSYLRPSALCKLSDTGISSDKVRTKEEHSDAPGGQHQV